MHSRRYGHETASCRPMTTLRLSSLFIEITTPGHPKILSVMFGFSYIWGIDHCKIGRVTTTIYDAKGQKTGCILHDSSMTMVDVLWYHLCFWFINSGCSPCLWITFIILQLCWLLGCLNFPLVIVLLRTNTMVPNGFGSKFLIHSI